MQELLSAVFKGFCVVKGGLIPMCINRATTNPIVVCQCYFSIIERVLINIFYCNFIVLAVFVIFFNLM